MEDLAQIRQAIDGIDRQLVALLEERLDLVNQVVAYKRANKLPVYDQEREQLLLEQVAYQVNNKDYEALIMAVFADLMSHSRNYQEAQLADQ